MYNSVRMRLDEKIIPSDRKNDDSIRGDYDDDEANDNDNEYDEL